MDKVPYPPSHLKKKIYVIDEVHMLSKGAFNALLKTIEEPRDTTATDKNRGILIDRDEKTGKSYLKVPLPEKEVVQNIFAALGELISKQ